MSTQSRSEVRSKKNNVVGLHIEGTLNDNVLDGSTEVGQCQSQVFELHTSCMSSRFDGIDLTFSVFNELDL